MKKVYAIIIIIVILAILSISVLYKTNKKNPKISECSWNNPSFCDNSCKINSDCMQALNCGCYNTEDTAKIIAPKYDKNGNVIEYTPCPTQQCACSNGRCGYNKNPDTEQKYSCSADVDCINSCSLGAVNKNWYENVFGGFANDCLDGCNEVGSNSTKCINNKCVSMNGDKIWEQCTKWKKKCTNSAWDCNCTKNTDCLSIIDYIYTSCYYVCDETKEDCSKAELCLSINANSSKDMKCEVPSPCRKPSQILCEEGICNSIE